MIDILRARQGEAHLLLDRSGHEAAHAVLLPVGGLHHLGDAGAFRSREQSEDALPLGRAGGARLIDACANPRFSRRRWRRCAPGGRARTRGVFFGRCVFGRCGFLRRGF